MTVREKVEDFLRSVSHVSIGYKGIHFFEAEHVTDEQVGYSVTMDGLSLVTGKRGDWKEEWLAIGYEEDSDEPVFVNMKTAALKVSSAQHGEDGWDPFYIADSLDNLRNIVQLLQTVSGGRANPEELEGNPISDEERQKVLQEIKRQNPQSEPWFWELFLEND